VAKQASTVRCNFRNAKKEENGTHVLAALTPVVMHGGRGVGDGRGDCTMRGDTTETEYKKNAPLHINTEPKDDF